MGNDPIVINESYLQAQETQYAGQVDDIDKLTGKVFAYGNLPGSHVDFTKAFGFTLGGANFTEAQDVLTAADGVRSGLADRFKSARGDLYTLEYGIKFLLADSNAVEDMSTLDSEQFEYFMPTAGT
jgi:hypothetical protein